MDAQIYLKRSYGENIEEVDIVLKGTNVSKLILPFEIRKNKIINKNMYYSLIHHKHTSSAITNILNKLNPKGDNRFMYIHADYVDDDEFDSSAIYYPNPDDENSAMFIGIGHDCIGFDFHKRNIGETTTYYDGLVADVDLPSPLSITKALYFSQYGASKYSLKRNGIYGSVTYCATEKTL